MNQERLYQVILGPHVSEKTTIMGEGKQPICVPHCNDGD
jgi:ribosomal protein L23